MTGFVVNASWTRYFATSEITELGDERKRQNGFGFVRTAKLRGGGEFIVDGRQADDVINPIVSVLPAPPGYNVIHLGQIDSEEWISRNPVLAWQVRADGEMRPMTIRGVNDGMMRPVPVEQPDGSIWHPVHDAIYDDIATMKADVRLQEEIDERDRQNATRLAAQESGS